MPIISSLNVIINELQKSCNFLKQFLFSGLCIKVTFNHLVHLQGINLFCLSSDEKCIFLSFATTSL